MPKEIDRRSFLRYGTTAVVGAAATAVGAAPASAQDGPTSNDAIGNDAVGVYGALQGADELGLMLPAGFTARVVARSGEPVGPSAYEWHTFPDGGATFALDDEFVYVSNSEVPSGGGGAGALRFSADGDVVDAYPILTGTSANCAGGPTPWGTWLSCEEHSSGQVWETDPSGTSDARVLPALGTFQHEAVAVDPDRRQLYLTEDVGDGAWYRFTPASWPALDDGTLEVATVTDGAVTWARVPDPSGATPTRSQVAATTPFAGGEGIWYEPGTVLFTTKGDGRVWRYDTAAETLAVLYETARDPAAVLDGPDNLTVTPGGLVLVAEDHTGDQELVLVGADGSAAPLLRLAGQPNSELTGPAFSPDGTRLFFSSQRGGAGAGVGPGITYEMSGPFADPPTTTTARDARSAAGESGGGGSGGGAALGIGVGVGAALVAAAGFVAWRRRAHRAGSVPPDPDADRHPVS